MKITDAQRTAIQMWIAKNRMYKGVSCPFGTLGFNAGGPYDGEICSVIFPELPERSSLRIDGYKICGAVCPCSMFDVEEVTRRAKKFLEEN